MRSLVLLCPALLALLTAGCASSSAGGLIGGGVVDDGEYSSDEMDMELEAEYFGLDGDEYDAAALDGEWSAEDRPTGPSIGSAIEDHFQNCLDGWSFTMRALGRRISRDSESMFGK